MAWGLGSLQHLKIEMQVIRSTNTVKYVLVDIVYKVDMEQRSIEKWENSKERTYAPM
jgi:hypothetical protein